MASETVHTGTRVQILMHPIIDGGGPSLNKHNCFIELACSLFNHSFIHSFVRWFVHHWLDKTNVVCVCTPLVPFNGGNG